MDHRFARYELRTTNVDAAQAFYGGVIGERPGIEVSVLPERARALGAVSHWLGHVSVRDVEGEAAAWVELGAQRLGPSRRSGDGFEIAALRDPFGAVFALTSREPLSSVLPVAWHDLNVLDQERAFVAYATRFGWERCRSFELESKLGVYQEFSYQGDTPVGGMLSSVRLPGIHPHWLYYFGVRDLDAATAEVVARGGTVVLVRNPSPGVPRAVICEDPERAIFALREMSE
jgi:predicted enzyme related to lactoylglutathione lyase